MPGSKAQAEKLLHGRDIQVTYLTATSNVKLASAREGKGSTSDDGIFAVYQMESFIGGKLILRVQLEEYKAGKFVRFIYDRRVQIIAPTIIGERVTYDFAFFRENDPKKGPSHPPIRIEIAVLERVGSDGLIVATGIAPTPTSKAG